MKITKNGIRKDRGDLKKDIINTSNTAKEIAQDKLHDVKRKAENVSDDIKKGSHEVAKDIQKTADKISRAVTSSND